jgi:hypothetical protein
MNPLQWKREHQIAGLVICAIGGVGGVLFAWIESSFHSMAVSNLSGEWSDYTGVFLNWLWFGHYWPWPLLGAIMAGLAFYAAMLLVARAR